MDLHNLSPRTKGKNEKKLAEAVNGGTTSGRGTKGQKSRADTRNKTGNS